MPIGVQTKTFLFTSALLAIMGVTAVTTAPKPPPPALGIDSFAADARARARQAPAPTPVTLKAAAPLRIPVEGVAPGDLADTWGAPREGGRVHRGMDILAPTGAPVLAAADGPVVKLVTSARGGRSIYQRDASGALMLFYAHLDAYAPGLAEGRMLRQGEVIGAVGATGNATTPHLHFEIIRADPGGAYWRGERVNPYPLLAQQD